MSVVAFAQSKKPPVVVKEPDALQKAWEKTQPRQTPVIPQAGDNASDSLKTLEELKQEEDAQKAAEQ